MIDLIIQISNLFTHTLLVIITLAKFNIYPIFVVASVFQSIFEIVKLFILLYQSTSLVKMIKSLPELTLEQIVAADKDSTCIVCQQEIEKGKLL